MTFEEFKDNVENWATERGIYEHSTPQAQLLKSLSELGELADAVIKDDRNGLIDAIGDVAVCLVNYAKMTDYDIETPCFDPCEAVTIYDLIGSVSILIGRHLEQTKADDDVIVMLCSLVGIAQRNNLDLLECCEAAWNEIKDRKGFLNEHGVFVKEDDV